MQSRIYEIFQTLVSSGTEFDGERIKTRYLGYDIEKPRTLLEVYEANNLEFERLTALVSKKTSIPRLEQVRDIFLFSCYTGLAYCDVARLTPENVVNGIDGDKWVFTCRAKTNTPSKIPLLPISSSIITKYAGHPVTSRSGKLLPIYEQSADE